VFVTILSMQLELETAPKRGRSSKWMVTGGICAGTAVIGICVMVFLWMHRAYMPLPKSIVAAANFRVYYPRPLPGKYRYKIGSAKSQDGVLFYTLEHSSSDYIIISEQATPRSIPDFTKLPGFSTGQTSVGTMVAGTLQQKPIALITGSTTLIDITGTKTVPSDIINTVAQSMLSVSGQ
jgi:hypothetical protein